MPSSSTTRSLAAITLFGIGVQSKPAMHLAVKGSATPYMFFTQYSADNNEVRSCEFGAPLSEMYITQVEPNRCHLVKVPQFSEEKYMMVVTKNGTTEVDKFLDICDPTCTTCTTMMSGALFSSCFETFEGSGLVLEKECIGSPELDENAENISITALFYTGTNCVIDPADLHSVLYARNYPKRQTSGCIIDDYRGNQKWYYDLAWEVKDGVTRYSGKFGCSDDECTVCKHALADTALDACMEANNDGDGSFKLMASKDLVHCGTEPAPEMWGCLAGSNYCGVTVAGEYESEAQCKAANFCTEPKFGCKSEDDPCAEQVDGKFSSMKDCVAAGACTAYGCDAEECKLTKGGAFATKEECTAICTPTKLYKCSGPPDLKCEENADGVPKENCDANCVPSTLKCSKETNTCVEEGVGEDAYRCDSGKCTLEACTVVGTKCFPKDTCELACA